MVGVDAGELEFREWRRTVEAKRRRRVLGATGASGLLCIGVGVSLWWGTLRHSELRSLLRGCSDTGGIEVSVYYGSVFSQEEVVFDLQDVQAHVRRVDVLHLLLRYARKLDRPGAPERLALAARGRRLFYLPRSDYRKLAEEHAVGNRLWSIHHFAERLRTMSGARAYGTWTGGWLGVMKKQLEDLNDFLDTWLGSV